VEKYKLIPVGVFETLDIPSIFLVNVNNHNFFSHRSEAYTILEWKMNPLVYLDII